MRLLLQRWNPPSRRWAVVVLILLAAWALVAYSAIDTEASYDRPTKDDWKGMPALQANDSTLSDSILRIIAEAAPFEPDRTPSDERYVLPSSRSDSMDQSSSSPLPRLRLVGTAVQRGGAQLAAFQVEQSARILRAGGTVGAFRVTRIEPGVVTLVGPDTTLTLHVPRPGSKDRQP